MVTRKIIFYLNPKNEHRILRTGNEPDRWFDSEAEAMQATESMIEDSPSIKRMDEQLLTIRYTWKNGRWNPKEDNPTLYYPYSDQLRKLVGFKEISRNTYREPRPEGEDPSVVKASAQVKKVYDVPQRTSSDASPAAGATGSKQSRPDDIHWRQQQELAKAAGSGEKKIDPVVAAVLQVTSEKYREQGYGGFRFGMSEEEISRQLSTEGLKPIRLPPTPLNPASSKSPVSAVIVTRVMREDGSQAFYFYKKYQLIAIERVYTDDQDKHLAELLELLGTAPRSDIDSTSTSGRSVRSKGLDETIPMAYRHDCVFLRYSVPSAIVYIRSRTYSEADDNQPGVSAKKSVKAIFFDREYALTQFTRDVAEKRKVFDWLRKVIRVVIQDRATIGQFPAFPGARLNFRQPSKGIQEFTWRNVDGKMFLTVTKYTVALGDLPSGTVEIGLSLDNLPGRWADPACIPGLFTMEGVRADVLLAEEVFSPDPSGIKLSNAGDRIGNRYDWKTADKWEVTVASEGSLFSRKGPADKAKR